MAEVEIKRGYEGLPDNNIRFGIKVTNTDGLVITDVEVILYYPESLFSLEGNRHQNLGNIAPASTRTAEFLLKPLGCVHEENIEAHISYRDSKGKRHSMDMRPKEVHCVCPFLKGLKIPKSEFLELSGAGHSLETGLNFMGVGVERLTSFLVQTCKSRHFKVDEFSIEGGRMLYLASESIGEKAYYLLTILIKDDGGLTQVMLRAVSDKSHGLNGFLNETVADLRHVVETVQSAREIGVIRKEQVINIIDSVVQRTSFGWGDGATSVNIQDSVVQRTEFNVGGNKKAEEDGQIDTANMHRKNDDECAQMEREAKSTGGEWLFTKIVSTNIYCSIIAKHSGKCLDISGIDTDNGADVIQWDWWGGDNQKWKFEHVGEGYFKIIAKHSGKYLDVSRIDLENGANIIQWDWLGGDNQKWRLII